MTYGRDCSQRVDGFLLTLMTWHYPFFNMFFLIAMETKNPLQIFIAIDIVVNTIVDNIYGTGI